MTRDEIETLVRAELEAVAPDIAGEPIAPDETFRDQFEIDSMDFFNFVAGLAARTGLDIPEADYPKLETLSGCLAYLGDRA